MLTAYIVISMRLQTLSLVGCYATMRENKGADRFDLRYFVGISALLLLGCVGLLARES